MKNIVRDDDITIQTITNERNCVRKIKRNKMKRKENMINKCKC